MSVSSSGAQGNGDSDSPDISADGRYVAFSSTAYNLVDGDNSAQDVFVHDRATGTTTKIPSYGRAGSISGDGRYVAFLSDATTLVPGDTNGKTDAFVYDRNTSTTTRVSVSSSGAQGDLAAGRPAISANGRYVVFESGSSTLVSGDTNNFGDVFVHDRNTATTTRVSVSSSGAQGNAGSQLSPVPASISADGRYVTFLTYATNLTTEQRGGVVVHDRETGATTLESKNSNDQPSSTGGVEPSISPDGGFVTFYSNATNLDIYTPDTNGRNDIFIRDRYAQKPSIPKEQTYGGCSPEILGNNPELL